MKITISDLADACEDQVALFRKTFGDEVGVTPDNIRLAVGAGLSIDWAVNHLLAFAPIRAEYEAKVNPIWAEYHAKVNPIRVEYYAKVKPIWDECHAKVNTIWAEYDAKCGEVLIDLFPAPSTAR